MPITAAKLSRVDPRAYASLAANLAIAEHGTVTHGPQPSPDLPRLRFQALPSVPGKTEQGEDVRIIAKDGFFLGDTTQNPQGDDRAFRRPYPPLCTG